jgi:hypothetical protein
MDLQGFLGAGFIFILTGIFLHGTGGLAGFKGSVESNAVSHISTGNYAGTLTTRTKYQRDLTQSG